MNEWTHTERRKFPRTNAAIQIELRADVSDVPLRTQTTDICENGCYIHTNITLEIGTRVAIVLWLGDRKISGTGRVVTRHTQFGNGIELELSSDDRSRLKAYLDSVANEGEA